MLVHGAGSTLYVQESHMVRSCSTTHVAAQSLALLAQLILGSLYVPAEDMTSVVQHSLCAVATDMLAGTNTMYNHAPYAIRGVRSDSSCCVAVLNTAVRLGEFSIIVNSCAHAAVRNAACYTHLHRPHATASGSSWSQNVALSVSTAVLLCSAWSCVAFDHYWRH